MPDEPDLQGTIESWTPGQKTCRGRQAHTWAPLTVIHHRTGGEVYEVLERCRHCLNRRVRHMNNAGYWLDRWNIDYRENYLLPRGSGRVAPALQATFRIAEILSRRIEEAPDE